jgi:hypothetical protein
MAGFTYRLEHEDGTPADPPTFRTAVPKLAVGGAIPLGHRTLQVVEVKDDDADQPPVLVVGTRTGEVRRLGGSLHPKVALWTTRADERFGVHLLQRRVRRPVRSEHLNLYPVEVSRPRDRNK